MYRDYRVSLVGLLRRLRSPMHRDYGVSFSGAT